MADNNQQVPWSDEQWARVRRVIQEEAARARVGATFLPLVGPLPPDTDYVSNDKITYGGLDPRLQIDDKTTIELATLQVKVYLRGAQMADPDMASALQLFRRAANVLARLEDSVIFNGLQAANTVPPRSPQGAQVLGGQECRGLAALDRPIAPHAVQKVTQAQGGARLGERLVKSTSDCIADLERAGHFGPFAMVLDHAFFTEAQTPNPGSLVLPQDRIIPFLGGGPLLRSSTLDSHTGVMVALGAAPVELVVATDVSLNFLQVTPDPLYIFRVYEKIVLRIKEDDAIKVMVVEDSAEYQSYLLSEAEAVLAAESAAEYAAQVEKENASMAERAAEDERATLLKRIEDAKALVAAALANAPGAKQKKP